MRHFDEPVRSSLKLYSFLSEPVQFFCKHVMVAVTVRLLTVYALFFFYIRTYIVLGLQYITFPHAQNVDPVSFNMSKNVFFTPFTWWCPLSPPASSRATFYVNSLWSPKPKEAKMIIVDLFINDPLPLQCGACKNVRGLLIFMSRCVPATRTYLVFLITHKYRLLFKKRGLGLAMW
jgi:hypothetical protein